ncbi:hypothetical protein LWI29_029667 [Acer saccharum]|uniref:Up-frameshift suppressor 2 C-terminal domain-containing protein n=1 Tax=Acer saccharum TaxID=4024 RepID=A0AA39SQK3_ACESA|nr:hypothetical protein LWI29_029667 [Acer saccharum]
MMIPINVFEGSSKDHHGRMAVESGDEALDKDIGEGKEVQVKVLVKSGNKQQTKQMYIPRDCSLARNRKKQLSWKRNKTSRGWCWSTMVEKRIAMGWGPKTLNSHWIPSGNGRVASRGSSWEGPGRRTGGSCHGHHHYPGGGVYHSRRK